MAEIHSERDEQQKTMLEKVDRGQVSKDYTIYPAGHEKSMRIWEKDMTRSASPISKYLRKLDLLPYYEQQMMTGKPGSYTCLQIVL